MCSILFLLSTLESENVKCFHGPMKHHRMLAFVSTNRTAFLSQVPAQRKLPLPMELLQVTTYPEPHFRSFKNVTVTKIPRISNSLLHSRTQAALEEKQLCAYRSSASSACCCFTYSKKTTPPHYEVKKNVNKTFRDVVRLTQPFPNANQYLQAVHTADKKLLLQSLLTHCQEETERRKFLHLLHSKELSFEIL